jgi:alpha 1,2-mannosyltransferase
MPTSVSIRSVRLLLVLGFALASLYFISRSYARIPIPPSANSFTPGGKEPAKPASQFPITSPTEHHHVAGDPQIGRMKAAFVTLVRNNELWEIVKSIRQVEDRFNRNYHYPWIFLNDEPFTKEFKEVTTKLTSGMAKYGMYHGGSRLMIALVPEEHWSIPSWIDEDKAKKAREDMAARNIIYGGSLPYRHMCRFQSGFFFRQPILDEYDWYWRVVCPISRC